MKHAAPRFGKSDLPRLGRHIRDLRLASGRTQADVARLAGLAESTVGAVEAGRSNPSLPTIVALASALGVSIDQIVAAATAVHGRVSITRANSGGGDLSAGLADPSLRARTVVLPQGQRHFPVPDPDPEAAVMVLVLDGVVLATTASGERLRLEAGDTAHARDGALQALSGLGAAPALLLCVTDPRRSLQPE
jgi:transcriptional regulator with XRE-family HTH domain